MIEGLKVSDKWAPISGSPIVNVSRVDLSKLGTTVLQVHRLTGSKEDHVQVKKNNLRR